LLQEKAAAWGCAVERVVSGSGKEGFAFITADDAVEARPFQNMPVAERAEARRTYWKARWGKLTVLVSGLVLTCWRVWRGNRPKS
jgi:hypothetical protein